MVELDPIYLMRGHTGHVRSEKLHHAFRYGVTLIDIDIDRLEDADKCSRLFSVDRINLVSFNTKKRGDLGGSSLADWVRNEFAVADIDHQNCSIRLITFPSTELYTFAPISVWLLLAPDSSVRAVLYEVNNTFGERHSYVAAVNDEDLSHEANKDFHVSPFFDRTGRYKFTLRNAQDNFFLKIDTVKNGDVVHTATLSLERHRATTKNLSRFLVTSPFAGIGVTLAIHWEALKLFLKGVSYHPRPRLAEHSTTYATETLRGNSSNRKSRP